MNINKLILAAGLAFAAAGAVAETGVQITRIDNVSNVYGRTGIPAVKVAGPVVTHPPVEVAPGPEIVQGATAVAVHVINRDVNKVEGRA